MPRNTTIAAAASGKPDPQHELRGAIRTVLSALPNGRAVAVSYLTTLLKRNLDIVCTDEQVEKALTWNADKGYVTYRYNDQAEWDEWYLTTRGKQLEGVK